MKKSLPWLILILLVFIWGSSFILMKKGLEAFTFQEVGALRIVLTFLALSPLVFANFKKIEPKQWKYIALIGVIGSLVPAFLFAKAQTKIDSSLAGILNSLTPLFTFLIGVFAFNFKAKWYNIIGLIVGLLGAIGLLTVSGGNSFEFNFSYAIYVIIATVCYALNLNLIKYFLPDVDSISITTFSFGFIGIPTIIYLFGFTDFVNTMQTHELAWRSLGYISILAIIATAFALIIFYKLVQLTNILVASSVTYLIPIIALMWGVIDGEIFKWDYLLWISLILGGVFMVNAKDKKTKKTNSK